MQSGTGPTAEHNRYEYTASGQRVVDRRQTVLGTSRRVFIGDLYELVQQPLGAEFNRYKILVGSRQVAEVIRPSEAPQTDEVLYLHDDHLGSTAVITDADTEQTGQAVETRTFSAFGEQTSTGDATEVLAGYTGHDNDASSRASSPSSRTAPAPSPGAPARPHSSPTSAQTSNSSHSNDVFASMIP